MRPAQHGPVRAAPAVRKPGDRPPGPGRGSASTIGHGTRRTAAMATLPRALEPLRSRGYRLLATSLALSLFSQGLWAIAVVWQVVELDAGPAVLGLVAGASAAGMLASTLLGGALADRV